MKIGKAELHFKPKVTEYEKSIGTLAIHCENLSLRIAQLDYQIANMTQQRDELQNQLTQRRNELTGKILDKTIAF